MSALPGAPHNSSHVPYDKMLCQLAQTHEKMQERMMMGRHDSPSNRAQAVAFAKRTKWALSGESRAECFQRALTV